MKHVMIDLETLDTRPTAVICSIGAVEFDPNTGEQGRKFYELIDWTNQPGRTICPYTVAWWLQQSDLARLHLTGALADAASLFTTLINLDKWLPEDCIVWGNGPTFDISILDDAYRQEDLVTPWKHGAVRDCRTIEDAANGIVACRRDFDRPGTYHHALDDATYQATYVSAMWRGLRGIRSAATEGGAK